MGCGCKKGVMREVGAYKVAVPAAGTRFVIKLPPAADVDSYSVVVLNQKAIAPAADVDLYIGGPNPMNDSIPALLKGAGISRAPGASYRATVPGDAQRITFDFAGLLSSDLATPTATVAQISIKACGGGGNPVPNNCG
jgi:hypothetical protein